MSGLSSLLSNQKLLALFAAHSSAFFFGTSAVFGVLVKADAIQIVFYRCLFCALSLFFIFKMTNKKLVTDTTHLKMFALNGVLLGGHWFSFFLSVKLGGAAIAALSYMVFPIFLVFLEPLFYRTAFKLIKLPLSLFTLLGVFLIVPNFSLENDVFLGTMAGVLSGLLFALLAIWNRKLTQKFSPFLLNFWQTAFGALFTAPFLFYSTFPATAHDLMWLLVLGVICTAGSHGLFIFGLRHVSVHSAGIIVSMEGIYTMIFAYFFLQENITLRMLAGGMIILLSAFLTNRTDD